VMDSLAILDSGNYAFRLCNILEKQGFEIEVISVPCQIAKDGCSYCLKFPLEYKDEVMNAGSANGLVVREMYNIIPMFSKNKYEKIY